MTNLSKRSNQKELLDNDSIPFVDIKKNMKELNIINTYLGGHKITLSGFRQTLLHQPLGKTLSICEIGCGGGDNLKVISDWCIKNKIAAEFTGIDIKPECIDFAKTQYPLMNANWIISDFKAVDINDSKHDIIFSSLFCHHFTGDELLIMLQWMKQNSNLGFFINDLQRHPLAYYAIKLITRLFSRSYLVKNDAPLSVARGFTKKEWKLIFENAGITIYSISWKWAFRYLIICTHDSK